MALFKRLFGQNGRETTPTSLSAAQLELLLRLSRQRVDKNMAEVWGPLVGPLERNVSHFVRAGLLEEASVAEKFDRKFRVADLEALLQRQGIRAKGRKANLVDQVLEALGPTDAARLVSDVRAYRPTPLGQQQMNAYLEERRQARSAMESEALRHLCLGDVRKAGDAIAGYEAQQVFPRGLGMDWSGGMPDRSVEEAEYLIRHHYEDLPLSAEQRRQVGAQLALSNLLGEPIPESAKRVLQVTNGQFPCTGVAEFLSTNPCGGYASGFHADRPRDLAELYTHARLFEASAAVQRKLLLSERVGKGIQILPVRDDACPVCSRGKMQYPWSQIDGLPDLPRHWGCRCLYSAWI